MVQLLENNEILIKTFGHVMMMHFTVFSHQFDFEINTNLDLIPVTGDLFLENINEMII